MKLMRTLKWLIVRMIMQMKCGTSLMRNHEALSLGRSYPDIYFSVEGNNVGEEIAIY